MRSFYCYKILKVRGDTALGDRRLQVMPIKLLVNWGGGGVKQQKQLHGNKDSHKHM